MADTMNAREAVLTFSQYLCAQKVPVRFGAQHDSAQGLALANKFCDKHDFHDVTGEYHKFANQTLGDISEDSKETQAGAASEPDEAPETEQAADAPLRGISETIKGNADEVATEVQEHVSEEDTPVRPVGSADPV